MIDVIRHSGENLLTIINDVLNLSKMEAGKMRIEAEEFDLKTMLEETKILLAPRAEEKGLVLRSEWSSPVGSLVIGDQGRLRQVLVNLVGNAVQFTEEGEVVLALSLVNAELGKVGIRIEVKDT